MSSRAIRAIISCFLAVIFPASLMMADAGAAMVYLTGAATLNGNQVSRSTTVFAGDTVQTNEHSAATITAQGSTVLVPANSAVTFRGKSISVTGGAATINTTKGLQASVGAVTVSPVNGNAKFQVAKLNGKIMIAAERGAVNICDGSHTTVLAEGNSASVSTSAPPQGGTPAAGGSSGSDAAYLGAGLVLAAGSVALIYVTTGAPMSTTAPR